jgi:putative SOS response-associated peptidase YedK
MCGRYVIRQALEAERYFDLHGTPWKSSFNIPPTVDVPAVRIENGERVALNMRWGLVPFFAKGSAGKYSTHNARIETFQENASYRTAWKRGQRCLQPASGFYEWHMGSDDRKVPFFIHLDRPVYAFAGLWDRSSSEDGASVIESLAHITMPGNALLADIHNTGNHPGRMPAILRQEDEHIWLTGTAEEALSVLQPYPADLMVAYPVSTRVNNVRHNDEQLLAPVG